MRRRPPQARRLAEDRPGDCIPSKSRAAFIRAACSSATSAHAQDPFRAVAGLQQCRGRFGSLSRLICCRLDTNQSWLRCVRRPLRDPREALRALLTLCAILRPPRDLRHHDAVPSGSASCAGFGVLNFRVARERRSNARAKKRRERGRRIAAHRGVNTGEVVHTQIQRNRGSCACLSRSSTKMLRASE
jgi:hypothetical protein